MRIETALFDNMVLQRTSATKGDARFSRCAGTGDVIAAVFFRGKAVKGLGKVKAGDARRGAFAGVVRGLPVGGPYEIRLSVETPHGKTLDRLNIKNVLVGDVWMLAGQSNMEGVGDMKHALKPHNMVRVFRMDGRWDVAKDPLHELYKAKAEVNRISAGQRNRLKGTGFGVSFGRQMFRLSAGVPQGLIASAHGGTSMAQWDPGKRTEGNRSLYGAMLARLAENGGKVAGLVWHQGCSDADEGAAPHYTEKMVEFVAAVRRDFGDMRLPVVIGQIGRYAQPVIAEGAALWSSIREQQRLLPGIIPRLMTVATIDLELDDQIHIGGRALVGLGRRYAETMTSLTQGRAKMPPPIQLVSVKPVSTDNLTLQTIDLVATFRNVVGKLKAQGRPNGFTLVEKGKDIASVYRVDLARKNAVIRTSLSSQTVQRDKALAYGYGCDPYCNILDEAGRSLPCFGPVALELDNEETCFFPDIEVSVPLEWPGDLANVTPLTPGVPMRPAVFQNWIVWPPERTTRTPGKDQLHYFRFRFLCRKKMRMKLLFGYDGPVKVWMDGAAVFTDPNGTNPIVKDAKTHEFTATKGRHEAVFAICTNKGRAWGIAARVMGAGKGTDRGKGYGIVRLHATGTKTVN